MESHLKNTDESEPSLLAPAYALLGAHSPLELNRLYTAEDQRLMKSREWDYENPSLVINQVKEILEALDPALLNEDEREWRQEIVWFWYHHAVDWALAKHDKVKAREFAEKALEWQADDSPNKITRMKYLLVNDRLEEAEEWASTIVDEVERDTAEHLLSAYKEGVYQ